MLQKINSAHGDDTRNKINAAIEYLNSMGYTYEESLQMARSVLSEAQQTNDNNVETNERLDKIISDSGTSSTEVVDARGDYTVLSGRLNVMDDLIADITVNVEDFGAISGGLVDSTSAIQSAIDFAADNADSVSEVYLPYAYLVSDELKLNGQVNLRGNGRLSGLIVDHDGLGINAKLDRDDYFDGGGYVRDMILIKKSNRYTGTGIKLNHFTRGVISNVYVYGFEKGIDTSGASWTTSIHKCYLRNNIYGIFLYATDEDFNNPKSSGERMFHSGFNGGAILENEIQGNYYGIYFEAHDEIGRLHSHGVWVDKNVIEGNMIRAIRHAYGTGALNIGTNYFESNGRGVDNPVSGHISPTIDATQNPNYGGDIRHVKADILLESSAFEGVNVRSGKVVIESNEVSSVPTFIAAVNAGGISVKDNRVSHNVVFFQIPDGETQSPTNRSALLMHNHTISSSIPKYINVPDLGVIIDDGSFVGTGDFAARGYIFYNNSVSPQEDLSHIPDDTNYFARVSGSSGYPTSNGTITGYKNNSNSYKYSWQTFVSSNGDLTRRRYARSPENWSDWRNIGDMEMRVTSDDRPSNPSLGQRVYDTTLNKPIWYTGSGWWRDANGETV